MLSEGGSQNESVLVTADSALRKHLQNVPLYLSVCFVVKHLQSSVAVRSHFFRSVLKKDFLLFLPYSQVILHKMFGT